MRPKRLQSRDLLGGKISEIQGQREKFQRLKLGEYAQLADFPASVEGQEFQWQAAQESEVANSCVLQDALLQGHASQNGEIQGRDGRSVELLQRHPGKWSQIGNGGETASERLKSQAA